jgi:hypothetical protein
MAEVDRSMNFSATPELGPFGTSTVNVETPAGVQQIALALWNPMPGPFDHHIDATDAEPLTGPGGASAQTIVKRFAISEFIDVFRSGIRGIFTPIPTLDDLSRALAHDNPATRPNGVFSEILSRWLSRVPRSTVSATDHNIVAVVNAIVQHFEDSATAPGLAASKRANLCISFTHVMSQFGALYTTPIWGTPRSEFTDDVFAAAKKVMYLGPLPSADDLEDAINDIRIALYAPDRSESSAHITKFAERLRDSVVVRRERSTPAVPPTLPHPPPFARTDSNAAGDTDDDTDGDNGLGDTYASESPLSGTWATDEDDDGPHGSLALGDTYASDSPLIDTWASSIARTPSDASDTGDKNVHIDPRTHIVGDDTGLGDTYASASPLNSTWAISEDDKGTHGSLTVGDTYASDSPLIDTWASSVGRTPSVASYIVGDDTVSRRVNDIPYGITDTGKHGDDGDDDNPAFLQTDSCIFALHDACSLTATALALQSLNRVTSSYATVRARATSTDFSMRTMADEHGLSIAECVRDILTIAGGTVSASGEAMNFAGTPDVIDKAQSVAAYLETFMSAGERTQRAAVSSMGASMMVSQLQNYSQSHGVGVAGGVAGGSRSGDTMQRLHYLAPNNATLRRKAWKEMVSENVGLDRVAIKAKWDAMPFNQRREPALLPQVRKELRSLEEPYQHDKRVWRVFQNMSRTQFKHIWKNLPRGADDHILMSTDRAQELFASATIRPRIGDSAMSSIPVAKKSESALQNLEESVTRAVVDAIAATFGGDAGSNAGSNAGSISNLSMKHGRLARECAMQILELAGYLRSGESEVTIDPKLGIHGAHSAKRPVLSCLIKWDRMVAGQETFVTDALVVDGLRGGYGVSENTRTITITVVCAAITAIFSTWA